jgi:hypothetical protein
LVVSFEYKDRQKENALLRRVEQLRDMCLEQTYFLRIRAIVVTSYAQLLVYQNKIVRVYKIATGIA